MEPFPQRLKPNSFKTVMYGLKAVPFRRMSFSQSGPDTKHDYLWSMGEATAL
jgi:hypothetical protein